MGAGASTRPAHQHPDGLYQHSGPGRGRYPLSGPGTPCAAAAAPQPRRTLLRLVLLCSTAPAAVCCCVTPHTRPTSLPASERCAAALKARHPSQCPPLCPVSVAGLRSPRSLVLTYNVGRLKARLRAGITARPKVLSGIPAPLGGPSCGGGPGSAGACARHVAPHIGPSRAGSAPLIGTPGPHPVKQCSTQDTASHPRRRFYQNGGRVAAGAPRQRCGRASAATPAGSKSGHPAKGNAACGRDGHTGEHPARVKYTACGGSCLMISGVAGAKQGDAAPCGRSPTTHPPPKRKDAAQ